MIYFIAVDHQHVETMFMLMTKTMDHFKCITYVDQYCTHTTGNDAHPSESLQDITHHSFYIQQLLQNIGSQF